MVNPTPIDSPSVGFISLEEAQKPIDGIVECFVNRWCLVHPEHGVVCHVRYQKGRSSVKKVMANPNKEVTERMRDLHWPWADVQQIPVVYNRFTDY